MDLAAQYNNRALVPDHQAIIDAWYRDAAAYRSIARTELDIAYGAHPRTKVDIVHPAQAMDGPLAVFVHGGYWRSLDRAAFSHMAAGANAHGLTVALPGYSLCPGAGIPDIVDELRQCMVFLHHRFGRRIVVAGHSAGGHLAACLAATDWSHFGAPGNLIQACFPISGVFDLRPLMATPLNDDLRLTPESAAVASPLLWPMPVNISVECWVGAEESQEFRRQSLSLAAAWKGLGLPADYREVPGRNHFNVPNGLPLKDSAMTLKLVELARR